MKFIINGTKYDTEKMEKISNVKKWYETTNVLLRQVYGHDIGSEYICELWKSSKGNWLLTHDQDYSSKGEAIEEEEAKKLLMRYNPNKYEELFEEIPDA